MELIYAYLGDVGRNFGQVGFNFSPQYDCKFVDGILSIEPKAYNGVENYYGKNIGNCNLVLGKNGTGKSTLFALLGKNSYERKDEFDIKKHTWFLVYHKDANLFVIEGWHLEYIRNIEDGVPMEIEYSIVVEVVNGALCYKRFHNNDEKEALILFQKNEKNFYFNRRKIFRDNSDYTVQTERHHTNYGYKTLYMLFVGKLIKSIKDFRAKKITMNFYLKSNSFSDPLDESKIDDIKLYNGTFKIVSELENRIKVLLNKESDKEEIATDKKILGTYTKKELFILNFLELSIGDFWNSNKGKDFYRKNRNRIINDIAQIKCTISYVERKRYLYEVIDILYQEYKNLMPKGKKTSDLYKQIILNVEACETLIFEGEVPRGFLINADISDSKIAELLNSYDEIIFNANNGEWPNSIGDFLRCHVSDMSDGELSLVNGLSGIMYAIDINKRQNFKKYILVLDEPDESLHPEWARKYLFYLTELINSDSDIKKVDIFITSHSPFMVTDFFKERILKIKVDEGKHVVENADFGLLSNIGSIIKNDFFLEYPFGEYAKNKLFEYRDKINRGNLSGHEIEDIEQYLSSIGDPYIQSTLRTELTKKIGKRLAKSEIIKKIQYYQEELEKIEETQIDD